MKKICLSLGAMMLSGLVLASCNLGGGVKTLSISKPKDKGNVVDELKFKVSGYPTELNFKKDDKFEDVVDTLSDFYIMGEYSREEKDGVITSEASYKENETSEANVKATNLVSNGQIYKNASYSVKNVSTTEAYMNDVYDAAKKEEIIGYKNYNDFNSTKMKMDDYSMDISSQTVDTIAGSYYRSYETGKERKVNIGEYNSEKSTSSTKSKVEKSAESKNKNVYKYVNDSEKEDDDDYGLRHYGYYANESYGYSLSDFSDSFYIDSYSLMLNFDSYIYTYSETFKDYFDYSFELTDKYIILKGSYTYTGSAVEYAERLSAEDATEDQVISKAKALLDKEFKGTKTTFEIWINHSKLAPDTEDEYLLQYSYAKKENVEKMNFSETYTKRYLQASHATEEIIKEMEGKKWTLTGTSKSTYEIAPSSGDYTKKIDSFRKKAEKNNIYKNIKLSTEDLR